MIKLKGNMRNKPCICGSDKTLKKCCWDKLTKEKKDYDELFNKPIKLLHKNYMMEPIFYEEIFGEKTEDVITEFSERSGLNKEMVKSLIINRGEHLPLRIYNLEIGSDFPILFDRDIDKVGNGDYEVITYNNIIQRLTRFCSDTLSDTEVIESIKEPFTTLKDHINFVWDYNKKSNDKLRDSGDYYEIGKKQFPHQTLLWLSQNHENLTDKEFVELFEYGYISGDMTSQTYSYSFLYQHITLSLIEDRKRFNRDFSFFPHLDDTDKQIYKNLPNKVKIYRGVGCEEKPNIENCGLSWSINKNRGIWFGRSGVKHGWLISGEVDKKDIISVFNGRNEYEVLVNPLDVRNKKLKCLHDLDFSKWMEDWNVKKSMVV